jgi:hypothetical protein
MRDPIFRGRVLEGKIVLDNRPRFRQHLSAMEGKRIELILREKLPGRSNQQNRYYWGIVLALLGEHLGYTTEEMHDVLKKKFKIESTTKLSTEVFEKYLSDIKQFAAQELEVNIPDPDSVEW